MVYNTTYTLTHRNTHWKSVSNKFYNKDWHFVAVEVIAVAVFTTVLAYTTQENMLNFAETQHKKNLIYNKIQPKEKQNLKERIYFFNKNMTWKK